MLDILGIGIIVPVLPGIVGQLIGGDEAAAATVYGGLVALYAVMQTLFSPTLGALSDRFGRRPVLLVALAGMGISYVILAWAPSLVWLYVGRALGGITGATITTANAYMADISTPETRSRNFGLLGAAFGVGFVLGPALGGLLGQYGARIPFIASAIVVFLNLMWGLFVLPESLAEDRRRPFTLAEATPLGGLRNLLVTPLVTGLAGVAFIQSLAQRALESTWVLYVGYRYGWNDAEKGLSLALVGVGSAVVLGGLAHRIIPRLGEPRAMLGGLAFNVLALVLYGFSSQPWMLLAAIPIGSLGYLAGPAFQGMITGAVPPERQGGVQGAIASLQSLSSIVAPVAATALFAWGAARGAPGVPFWVAAGAVVASMGVGAYTLAHHYRREDGA